MSSTKSARAPAGTKALPAHLTALGGFYRRRPKFSAGLCRAAGCRTSAGCIGRAAAYRAGDDTSDKEAVFIWREAKVMSSTKSARAPAGAEVLPAHLTAAGNFHRRRPKLSAGPCRAAVHRAGGGPSSGRRLYRAGDERRTRGCVRPAGG